MRVFEQFERERDERIRKETFEKVLKVVEMLKQNQDVELIAKEVEFSIEQIKMIYRSINSNEKVWDKIDKIADQYDGHYVEPTVPDKVETSDISSYIQKIKFLSEEEELRRFSELKEKHLSDSKTRINGTKREIAKNLLNKNLKMSIEDIAKIVKLEIEEVSDLVKQVNRNKP
ncbi:hypothetical protein [Sutcliffiella cohnii]|uniref:hypothetical protein n=1 Tax=Sutcliffiella cohnii TaxID=33932 RepID=UPI002E1B1C48|nr:hypothetical protein [Sutcliffiella cohnii]